MMLLLASVTGVYAESADGILSVNVMNAIEGYAGGRMDIVLNNTNTQEWASFQFDIKAPAGVTITGGEAGELFNGHTLNGEEVDETNHVWRFTAANISGTTSFKSTTGTLMTVKFTVANPYETENGEIELSTISVGSVNAVDYDVANFNTPFAIDNTTFTVDENSRTIVTKPNDNYFNVIVKRTLKPNVWNTIMLPFAIQFADIETVFGDGTTVAEFTGANFSTEYNEEEYDDVCVGITMSFRTLSNEVMKPGKPYLIKVPSEKNQIQCNNVKIVPGSANYFNVDGNKMTGTYICQDVPSGKLYVSNNSFKYSGGQATIKGLRGYFDLTQVLYGWNNTSAGARILFNIDGENTTGIFNMEEGTIEKNHKYYNLQGQRVANPTKGVYVVDGKKVMFK